MISVVEGLAGLGVLLAIPHVYRISSFIWLYYLRPSSIRKYLHGPTPYALVTGATDGIGKGIAAELLRKDFNLILHGRNEQKMKHVIEELRALVPEKSKADIRYFLADASKSGHDFAAMVAPFKDLHITLVYHNVGGSPWAMERIDERPEGEALGIVHLNALFSLLLTRVLLPHLRCAAASGPVQVTYTGSFASDLSPARLAIYAGSKAFLEALARGLDNDELFFDGPTGVRFQYLSVGPVYSDNHEAKMDKNATTPTSEVFGKAVVARTGCGLRRVAPFALHSVVMRVLQSIPESTRDKMSADGTLELITRAKKVT